MLDAGEVLACPLIPGHWHYLVDVGVINGMSLVQTMMNVNKTFGKLVEMPDH